MDFRPRLTEYVIVTTAKNDEAYNKWAAEINEGAWMVKPKFLVRIVAAKDLQLLVETYDKLDVFDPLFSPIYNIVSDNMNAQKINIEAMRAEIQAFGRTREFSHSHPFPLPLKAQFFDHRDGHVSHIQAPLFIPDEPYLYIHGYPINSSHQIPLSTISEELGDDYNRATPSGNAWPHIRVGNRIFISANLANRDGLRHIFEGTAITRSGEISMFARCGTSLRLEPLIDALAFVLEKVSMLWPSPYAVTAGISAPPNTTVCLRYGDWQKVEFLTSILPVTSREILFGFNAIHLDFLTDLVESSGLHITNWEFFHSLKTALKERHWTLRWHAKWDDWKLRRGESPNNETY
jgi:hypothetical protein